jgi:CRP/FNR family transcriptional regulator, cyclic AMP receptor protein
MIGCRRDGPPMRESKSSRRPKPRPVESKTRPRFNVVTYLKSTGPARKIVKFREGDVVFAQGDACNDVRFLQKGAVKLSVLSHIGKKP